MNDQPRAAALIGQHERIQARQGTDYAQLAAASRRFLRAPDSVSPAFEAMVRDIVAASLRDPAEVARLTDALRAAALRECGRDVVQAARGAGL
jgi:urease gamma subunit